MKKLMSLLGIPSKDAILQAELISNQKLIDRLRDDLYQAHKEANQWKVAYEGVCSMMEDYIAVDEKLKKEAKALSPEK